MYKLLFTLSFFLVSMVAVAQVGNNNGTGNNNPGNNDNPCYTYGDTVSVGTFQGIVLVDTCGGRERLRDTLFFPKISGLGTDRFYETVGFLTDTISGKLQIMEEDQDGAIFYRELQFLESLPDYDNEVQADLDPNLELGGFWKASENNTMGVRPGTIYVKD